MIDSDLDSDEVIEMAVDISNGAVDPPAWYNKERRDTWKRLLREIREIEAKGGTVGLPSENP
jgi:hypothetical protein